MSENKRGKYNTKKAIKMQDQIEFASSIFGETLSVDNETYAVLCGGGRINSKYNDQFMFVKTGRAPDSCVEGFSATQLLSDAKIEQVKISNH